LNKVDFGKIKISILKNMAYNLSEKKDLEKFKKKEPARWQTKSQAVYCDLRKVGLITPPNVDLKILERLAKVVRGFLFAAVEAGQSGHPGSSSKTEEILSLLLGHGIAFDPINPKNPGRDRIVWSAGHCTPLIFSTNALIYESLRRVGRQFYPAVVHPVLPDDLLNFRRLSGLPGHAESTYPLIDFSTGPSGHGLSAAGGMAISHHSSGLPTKIWVMMGDAESEEGMTYEARNILSSTGTDNIIVTLDYNHFGIDGPIEEVINSEYLNHWWGLGWNVIEVDGHNFAELITAYRLAEIGFDNQKPTVVISHTLKGKGYGAKENTAAAHGVPASHEEYVAIMKKLGFNIPGEKGATAKDIETVLETLTTAEEQYVATKLEEGAQKIIPENKLVEVMKEKLSDRPLINPLHLKRPATLPPELIFAADKKVATREAAGAWLNWLMKQTAFLWTGAGDLSGSINTAAAEKIYGIINPDNPTGRGIRFGIAEQNMAMMGAGLTADILPGGFQPISVFGTFAVFTTMIGNCIRLALINDHLNPTHKGFFVVLASHDGPDTAEDGPTHQGLYWMSLYQAMPGIKVYKPLDANETIEMLFGALEKGEPIILSLSRVATTVWDRTKISAATEANNGAYIFQDYKNNKLPKKVLAVSGAMILENIVSALPELEKTYNLKIVTVTSPELFAELEKTNPTKAAGIISDAEKKFTTTIHNGWKGFLNDFVLTVEEKNKAVGVDTYLKSGTAKEVYEYAGLDTDALIKRILQI